MRLLWCSFKLSCWGRMLGAIGGDRPHAGSPTQMEHEDQVIAEYNETISLDSQDAAAFKNRGAAHEELGHYQLALQDEDEAVRLDPQLAGAYNPQASISFKLGEYNHALVDVTEAIRLDTQLAGAHAGWALSYTHLGMDEEAQQDVELAVESGFDRELAEGEIERLKEQRHLPDEADLAEDG